MFGSFTDFTPAQADIMRDQVLGGTYQRFLKLVADSRHLPVDKVDAIAQGRVWTGEQALPIKLVDTLGGFDAALEAAKQEGNLTPGQNYEIEELPEQPSLIEQLLGGGLDARAPAGAAASLMRPWSWLLRIAESGRGFRAAYCPLTPVM